MFLHHLKLLNFYLHSIYSNYIFFNIIELLPTIKSKDIASVIYHKILNFINLGHDPVVPINYFIIQIKIIE